MMPEFPEDAYPNVPEMEPLKEELNNYLLMWKHLEQLITDNLIQILTLDISNKTPKELLQRVVETTESKADVGVGGESRHGADSRLDHESRSAGVSKTFRTPEGTISDILEHGAHRHWSRRVALTERTCTHIKTERSMIIISFSDL